MITFAFCTYKRADRLEALVSAIRTQSSPEPFEILVVNNNSPDDALTKLELLANQPGPALRYVTEMNQGIVPARNRALFESMKSDILIFIDDDELPHPGLVNAAIDAIRNEGASCVGGRVFVNFENIERPKWLGNELLGFLAEVNYGDTAFWIKDDSTPIWTANVAYDMNLFRKDMNLRFDARYDRKGSGIGGGEDVMMFNSLLSRKVPIRYRPDMIVDHFVEAWRLSRLYFLKLHYHTGLRTGQYELPEYQNRLFGVPMFLIGQLFTNLGKVVLHWFSRKPCLLRQAMTAAHAMGVIVGYRMRTKLKMF